jgi:histone-lysine N-methyltransferase SETMAR
MLINLFDSKGVVHKEFVPEGKRVNAEFYKGVMDSLLKGIKRVLPAAFCPRDFFLLHDNAPAHKAASVCQFLTQKMLQPFVIPPYSPNLSPLDYFLFSKLKVKLKVFHFPDVVEIQEDVTDELQKVHKEEISSAFQKMYDRAKVCIYDNEDYFEFKKYVSSSCVFYF